MKIPSEAELIEMDRKWMAIRARLMDTRREMLTLEGDQLMAAHGCVIGVMCALERLRGRKEHYEDRSGVLFRQTDRLIRELRESEGPL
jgi:hypothetical protein